MANKHIKRCRISVAIRGMKTKITMRYQYTPMRRAKTKKIKIKNLMTTLNAGGDTETLDHSYIDSMDVKWHSHSGKVCHFLTNEICNYHITQQVHFWAFISKK